VCPFSYTTAFLYRIFLRIKMVFVGLEQVQRVTEREWAINLPGGSGLCRKHFLERSVDEILLNTLCLFAVTDITLPEIKQHVYKHYY
jgi:hypothetical protein